MPRATRAAWKAARERWERDSSLTHADIANQIGCARATVTQMAGRQGWSRVDPHETLAQVVATLQTAPLEVLADADILDITVARRVQVLNTQREAMRRWREVFDPEVMAMDEAIAKRGKLVVEALEAAARAEANCWGLNDWDRGLPSLAEENQMAQAPRLPEWVDESRLGYKEGLSQEALEAPEAPLPPPPPEKTLPAAGLEQQTTSPPPPAPSPFPIPSWYDGPGRPATGALRDDRKDV